MTFLIAHIVKGVPEFAIASEIQGRHGVGPRTLVDNDWWLASLSLLGLPAQRVIDADQRDSCPPFFA